MNKAASESDAAIIYRWDGKEWAVGGSKNGGKEMRGDFIAHAVAVLEDQDINAYMIVLEDNPETPSHTIEIQKAIKFDEQEVKLGMDTYCVVTDGGTTYYGGIESCQLENGYLSLDFTEDAAVTLGLDGLDITLSVPNSTLGALRYGLLQIFENDRNKPKRLVI